MIRVAGAALRAVTSSQVCSIARNKSLVNNIQFQLLRSAHHEAGHKNMMHAHGYKPTITMDELPVPAGSYAEANQKKQSFRNIFLLVSILFFAGTLTFVIQSDIIEWNLLPPKITSHPKRDSPKKKRPKGKAVVAKTLIKPEDIPKYAPYLLIGGGTASFAAFRAIKAADPKAKILVLGEEEMFPYMRPPLSKELWFSDDPKSPDTLRFKQWNGRERSLFYEHEDFYCTVEELANRENGGVAMVGGVKVTRIDAGSNIVHLDNGRSITYERCLLATGGSPKNLPVFEKADEKVQDKVVIFRNVPDFQYLEEMSRTLKHITIIGGGFLGSELAVALGNKQGLKVCQAFPEAGNMGKVFPDYLSHWTSDKLRSEGIDVIPEVTVKSATSKGDKVLLQLSDGKEILTDLVVVAVGIEPNTQLAESSGLETDPVHGGFLVNSEMEARSNLWVAGDAACFYDPKLGRRRVEHHDHAVVSGRLAGENMTGRRQPYHHQSMFWSDLGPELGYEAIGIVDSSLPTVAVFAKATEEDTPKAVVTATGEGVRSITEQSAVPPKPSTLPAGSVKEGEAYGKGVIFYLRNNVVVGIVMWNVFGRMPVARKIIAEGKKYDDLSEVAKLFSLYSEEYES